MRKLHNRAHTLLKLLKEKSHFNNVLAKLDLKEELGHFEKSLLKYAKQQMDRINLSLQDFNEYELLIGNCLDTNLKNTVFKKCNVLSLTAHDYIKSVNDFELDEEKSEKITDFQMFLVAFIIACNTNLKFTYNDLYQLSNTALTETQFDKLVFDLKIGDNNGIKTALSNNEINTYKGD